MLKKTRDTPSAKTVTSAQPHIRTSNREEQALYCVICRFLITKKSQITQHAGQSDFFFINPAGYDYTIKLFKEAKGSVILGEPTTEASWFSGYAWCFCICGQCGSHLGWHYSAPGKDSFYGLIKKRLVGG